MFFLNLHAGKHSQTLKQLPLHLCRSPNPFFWNHTDQKKNVLERYYVEIKKTTTLIEACLHLFSHPLPSEKTVIHEFNSKMCNTEWALL